MYNENYASGSAIVLDDSALSNGFVYPVMPYAVSTTQTFFGSPPMMQLSPSAAAAAAVDPAECFYSNDVYPMESFDTYDSHGPGYVPYAPACLCTSM
jgi:hypothetical protein